MSDIYIVRRHTLEQNHLYEAAESLAHKLSDKFDVRCHWEDDDLCFSRSGVDGYINVGQEEVIISVQLGFMLKALRPVIEAEAYKYLDQIAPEPE